MWYSLVMPAGHKHNDIEETLCPFSDGPGKYRQAEKELGKALRLAPDWHWLYDNLCGVG